MSTRLLGVFEWWFEVQFLSWISRDSCGLGNAWFHRMKRLFALASCAGCVFGFFACIFA